MKIVILNESFISDSYLNRLEKIGEVENFLDTDTEEKAIARVKDADIIITDMFVCPLTNKVLDKAKKLKLIALNTTGFDKIDLGYMKKRGIKVCNCPGYATDAVAEQALALMMSVARKVVSLDKAFREKPFEILPDHPGHREHLGITMAGKTLGVIGVGNIGQRICEIGQGLGMKVIAYNRTKKSVLGVKLTSLEKVLSESDIIIISIAFNKETENLINKNNISKMKKQAILINIARDKIVNTDDLYEALSNKEIFGAGLDVFSVNGDKRMLELDNVVFTPHSAWFTQESLNNLGHIIVDNIESFAKGKGKNFVN
jgi:lactate dehydrogenase-like 2-hydroxyacid dehydrogenase